VLGFDVIEDEDVPDGQIWMDAPGPDGQTIRYVIDLNQIATDAKEPASTGQSGESK
jgi:hypothetical protein